MIESFGIPEQAKLAQDFDQIGRDNSADLVKFASAASLPLLDALNANARDLAAVAAPLKRSVSGVIGANTREMDGIGGVVGTHLVQSIAENSALLANVPIQQLSPSSLLSGGNGTTTCTAAYLILRWPASQQVFPCPALDQSGTGYMTCPEPDRIYSVCYPQQMPLRAYKTAGGYQFYRWRDIGMAYYFLYKSSYPNIPADEWPALTEAMGVEVGNG